MCIIPKRTLQEKARQKYRNVLGFVCMAIGYLLSSLSPGSPFAPIVNILLTAAATVALLGIDELLIRLLTCVSIKKDERIPFDNLSRYGADTVVTNEEIPSLFQ